MMIFLQLIWVFLKIGTFGFGGGYAMLSLIQEEVVERHAWMSKQEFTDLVAISQMTPGPIGINTATYAGYTAIQHAGYASSMSMLGAAVATIALCIPSFVMILVISYFFLKFRSNVYFTSAMRGIRPLGVSLIALAALSLANVENFVDPISTLLFLAALVAVIKFKLHPVLILAGTALIGLAIY
ncbi:chromate transporter [Sphingobacterium suaedae]|uniref:Chromate transporter n=1 Tax=Sphingobacterium suaedae TaxID=1686402 RepID=A0ABW5KN67_9SPHI